VPKGIRASCAAKIYELDKKVGFVSKKRERLRKEEGVKVTQSRTPTKEKGIKRGIF